MNLPPFAFGSSSEKSKMFSLGGSDLRSVLNRFRCNTGVDGSNGEGVFVNGSGCLFTFENGCNGELVFVNGGDGKFDLGGGGGNGQVGGLDTESQTVSNVVGGLDDAVGINI